MNSKPPYSSFVPLKDGSMLKATSAQLERLNQAILSRTDFQDIQVKLDGHSFKLGDIETDPEKIAMLRQASLAFDDVRVTPKKDFY